MAGSRAGRSGALAAAALSIVLPLTGAASPAPPTELFATSDRCLACHNGLLSTIGEDVSIGSDWRASMMANAARDPYWQAAVRRETVDHPEAAAAIEHECSACHMPMARYEIDAGGGHQPVLASLPLGGAARADRLPADGVSCTLCHRIEPDGLGSEASFSAGFTVDETAAGEDRAVYGPYVVDAGLATVMRSAARLRPAPSEHLRSSEMCASCHTLFTHSLGPDGAVVGTLPEQVPYLEWRHSAWRDERGCPDCHMPAVEGEAPISAVLGALRPGVDRHAFRGGNFFMPRLLDRYRDELAVTATSDELLTASRETEAHLASAAARLELGPFRLAGGRLAGTVTVTSSTGHKLPTAYPSRRAWLHLTVRDRDGRPLFESGALGAGGRIVGNDGDDDAGRYEAHHEAITAPDQVQIYEAVLADLDGAVTTGLLTAVRYLKDNRLLPRGFDKRTAGEAVAVHGAAVADADFEAGVDRLRLAVDVGTAELPLTVEAELLYQPIGYRWARNVAAYEGPEPARFARYYDGMADAATARLARAVLEIE